MNAEVPVQRQLEAYNNRDLAAFCANFSEDIKVYRPPATEPAIVGQAQFAEFYQTKRFNLPGLHAEVLHRSVIENRVFDHERVSVPGEATREVMVAYQVEGELIHTIWFFG